MSTEGEKMTVRAGRHKSADPAAVFADGLGVTNVMGLEVDFDLMPKELNFVVYGNITF